MSSRPLSGKTERDCDHVAQRPRFTLGRALYARRVPGAFTFGADGINTAGRRGVDPTQIFPQPLLVPLNEVLPYAGIPIATSDPPPWDATAVLSQPSVVTHRPPIKS